MGLASVLGYIAHRLKLPLLIAYLVGGLLLVTTTEINPRTSEVLSFLPEIGIAFVLFLVGMELDLREIKNLGKPIILSGFVQIIITSLVGFIISQAFGFGLTESVYLGIGLSFSSTVVVIKLLEKKGLGSLYGKLSLGILLLEDLLAVLMLLALTVSPSIFHLGFQQASPIAGFILKVFLLFGGAFALNKFILPIIFKGVSESSELLFLTALAWCFIYVSFSIFLGFSVVIGAFLAGVALASSHYHFHIQSKVKPLRDFFVTLFFVYLGTQVNFDDLGKAYPLILVFTLYALIVKPVILLLLLGGFGFKKHTMFQTSIYLSQISEFSLIVLLVGYKNGVVSSTALTAIALSVILSTIISSVMVARSRKIYSWVKHWVALFERKGYTHYLEESHANELTDHVVVIGGHRVGGEIVRFLQKENIALVVLEFNPYLVDSLVKEKIDVIYGDMGDPEILDLLNLKQAKMIISTSPDMEDNKLLLEEVKSTGVDVPVIVRASGAEEAKILYKAGADYVIIPEVLAGEILVDKLKDHLSDKSYFRNRPRIEMERLHKKTFVWE